MFELLLWAVFLFLIFVNALQYFFEIDFKASITDLFGNNPQDTFKIASDIDQEYSNLLSKAVKHKLKILCYDCKFTSKGISINKCLKFLKL